ncbi:hypothetical protein ENSA5_18800 [Enhygromyxa salina]|uniref:Uncharacterized protein n=1 Tax=Enhygromyxa salina TaxID=215803 RepID=A0A2S9YD56_9BACT|nr:hypothetical protein [Enhygromyxa salina]PRQ02941.1 hypothetical protein ENSA5_18800 [Enhygromyxa salina]
MKKRKDSRVIVGILSVVGLSLGLVYAGAFAPGVAKADDKIVAGQICVAVNSYGISVPANYDAQQITKRHASTHIALADEFVCPLVRDETNDDLDRVRVWLYNDDTADTPPYCCIYSFEDDGESMEAFCTNVDNDSGAVRLDLENLGFHKNEDGYHVLTCELEVGDGIRSIATDE